MAVRMQLPHHASPIAHLLEGVPFILASASPRRADLLRQIGIEADIYPSNIDEEMAIQSRAVEKAVIQLASMKAAHVAQRVDAGFILAADTVVVAQDEVMGKPEDAADARRMLVKLSGDSHYVVTGVCLMRNPQAISLTGAARTKVTFSKLHPLEIENYLRNHEFMDKAGAYGIQEAPAVFVEQVEGCYNNVVGLPLNLVRSLVVRIGQERGV